MMLFLFIALGLIFLVAILFFKVWSNVQSGSNDNAPEWQALVGQRDEIERDASLSETTREELRQEWATVANDVLAKHPSGEVDARLTKKATMLLMTSVALLGVMFYLAIGHLRNDALQLPDRAAVDPMMATAEPPPMDGAKHPGGGETLEQRIAKLQEKLKENPKDVDRWVLLARSLGVQRDYKASADALREALKLAPDHPDLLADLADTVAMVNGKSLSGEPSDLILRALKSDPKHPKALALAATAAMQKGDKEIALKLWQTLRAGYPETSPDVARIDEIVKEINTRGLQRPAPMQETIAQEPEAQSAQPVESASVGVVAGDVRLDKSLITSVKSKLTAQSVLYVFAKMESGPPMPLAVLRTSPEVLLSGKPMPFKLDDSMAMSPAFKLSNAKQVKLEARISIGGNAIKQAEDIGAMQMGVKVGTQDLHLVIGTVEK